MIGFGSIGQAVLPLILEQLHFQPEQITIVSDQEAGAAIAQAMGITLRIEKITSENYENVLHNHLQQGDFLLNLSTGISSLALIELCQKHGWLYLDTCTEPWEGVYYNKNYSPATRTNYALREKVLALKKKNTPTAVITHGANPGLVSHFVKQALCNLAEDNGIKLDVPKNATEWANLAQKLGIKSIQIAEHDTQTTNQPKVFNEFVNTWSVDGFIAEGGQPAELGWGTHERHWPYDACEHNVGPKCAIYLERPGASTKVRTWTPHLGPIHGFLITHAEAISISNYLTIKEVDQVSYRPTVYYAYAPCPHAILSLHEFAGNEWSPQQNKRILLEEIIEGTDALGVLLMGNQKGAYWYGSQLSIQEARRCAPYNNATTLQVAIGVIAGMRWALDHPQEGVVEPEEIDHQYIMALAQPYLGNVAGYYTNWTPLENREQLFQEKMLDRSDPWQFVNIRV